MGTQGGCRMGLQWPQGKSCPPICMLPVGLTEPRTLLSFRVPGAMSTSRCCQLLKPPRDYSTSPSGTAHGTGPMTSTHQPVPSSSFSFHLSRWTLNLFVHVEPWSAKSCKSPSDTKDRHTERGCRAATLWEPEVQVLTTIFTMCQRSLTSPAPSEWLWWPFESQGQALWIQATKSTTC